MGASFLSGRGLWYSPVDPSGNPLIFNEKQWRLFCGQARTWGITILHPKVGEGVQGWYDDDGFNMLRDIALGDYKLACVPYLSIAGSGELEEEVRLAARVGSIFGSLCIEIKEKWETYQSPLWVSRLGQLLRQSLPALPLYVTSFGFPAEHPAIPWLVMNQWMSAYLPQVFFASGKQRSADEAILLAYSQWKELDQHCRETMGRPLAPIAPVIELGYSLPQEEVLTWLMKMGGYGYCGFWHAGTYLPYANTILHAPIPVRQSSSLAGSEKKEDPAGPAKEASSSEASSVVEEEEAQREPARPLLGGNTSPYPTPSPSSERGGEHPYATSVMQVVKTSTPRVPETPLPMTVFAESLVEATPPTKSSSPLIPQSLVPYLDGKQLQLLWQSRVKNNPYDPDSPIVQRWGQLVEMEANIGAPMTPIKEITIDGETIQYMHCSSGKSLIFFVSLGRVLVL